jgi:hypothetical protein
VGRTDKLVRAFEICALIFPLLGLVFLSTLHPSWLTGTVPANSGSTRVWRLPDCFEVVVAELFSYT